MKFTANLKTITKTCKPIAYSMSLRLKSLMLAVFLFLNFSIPSLAQVDDGFISISESRSVAYRYSPAQKGQPTIVVLNGLIYPLANWDDYLTSITEQGFGVLLVAYSTQPESLRKTEGIPYYSRFQPTISGLSQSGLEIEDLATDVISVVDHLKLDKFHLQTLSFGSIIGSYIANNYADRLESITLISPAVMPSHRYTPYGESRHKFYLWMNEINVNPLFVPDYYYDLELYQTMRLMLQTQYNTFDLAGVNFEYFFNGVYQMARSTKYFDLKDETLKSWPQTNIIIASDEDPTLKRDQFNFWNEKFRKAPDSRLIEIMDVPHAIPGTHPQTLAKVSAALLAGSISAGEHKFLSDSNSWLDEVTEAANIDRSCKTFLRPRSSSTVLTFGTF